MKLIKKYLSLHLKISLEYKSSFILSIVSQTLYLLVELCAVYALFMKFGLLSIYNKWELLLGFTTVWFGYSIAELFGRGFDDFDRLIVNGKFDLLLTRPRSLYLQIFGEDICYEKSGRVLTAGIIYFYSAFKLIKHITILKLILLFLMIIGCVVIIISLFIIAASVCFKTIQGIEIVNVFTNGTKQVAEYPMQIYKKPIRVIFTVIIPISLINYYPILYLTSKSSNILYIFYPLLTFIFLFVSRFIFNLGIKKYCSTGS